MTSSTADEILDEMFARVETPSGWDAAVELMERTIHGAAAIYRAEQNIEDAKASGVVEKLRHAKQVHRIVKEISETDAAVLARFGDVNVHRDSQMHSILKDWFPKLRAKAKERSDNRTQYYRDLVADAAGILRDIQSALSSHVKRTSDEKGRWPFGSNEKDDAGWLWRAPGSWQMDYQPSNWQGVSPVDQGRLADAVTEYRKRDWLQHNFLEWAAINALLFDEIARLRYVVSTGIAFNEWNWAYIFAGQHKEKLLIWTLGLRLAAVVARWIIPPIIVVGLANAEYLGAAKIIGAVWGLYVLYRIVTWPARRRYRKTRDQELERFTEISDALRRAWLHSDNKTINPTRLKQLVLEVESKSKRAGLSPVIHSLLDRAIQRDPAVFISSGPKRLGGSAG